MRRTSILIKLNHIYSFLTTNSWILIPKGKSPYQKTLSIITYMSDDRDGVKIDGEMGATHMVLHEEQAAFADWINTHLGRDADLGHKLRLREDGGDMYEQMDDGVILCKMINLAAPDTIDERVINKGKNIPIFKVSFQQSI